MEQHTALPKINLAFEFLTGNIIPRATETDSLPLRMAVEDGDSPSGKKKRLRSRSGLRLAAARATET